MQGRLAVALKARPWRAARAAATAVVAAACCGLSVVGAAPASHPAPAPWGAAAEARAAADQFMSRLCGTWRGTGSAEGVAVVDELDVDWSSDRLGLVARSRAASGDAFAATTQLRYQPQGDRFDAVERNNGRWPLRHFSGRLVGHTLQLLEVHDQRRLRLTLTPLPGGDFELQESQSTPASADGAWPAPFVVLRYTRTGPGDRCARAGGPGSIDHRGAIK
jgi:hypothetical protein